MCRCRRVCEVIVVLYVMHCTTSRGPFPLLCLRTSSFVPAGFFYVAHFAAVVTFGIDKTAGRRRMRVPLICSMASEVLVGV